MTRQCARRFGLFLAALLMLLVGTPVPALQLHEGTLPNGLQYVLVDDHSRDRVAVSGCFRIGGRTETLERKGLTHFLEHLIGRGGSRELSEEEWRAARTRMDFSGYTGHDGSCYDFQVAGDELPDALADYAAALFELEITPTKVAQEREVVLQELLRGLAMPFGPESHRLWPTAFTRHPYRTMTISLEEVIRGASADELRKVHAEGFTPNHLFLALVGDFDDAEMENLLRETLGAYPAGAPSVELGLREPPQEGYREVRTSATEERSRLLLGCKTPGASHPDAAPLDVAARVLGHGSGSRLAAALLDTEVALSASVSSSSSRDPGLFIVRIETHAGREEPALSLLWKALREMAPDGVGSDEVSRSQRSLEVDRALSQQTQLNRARALTAAELAGSYTLALSYPARLRAVTAEDVGRAIGRYLAPDRCSLVATVAGEGLRGWRQVAEAALADWPGLSTHRGSPTRVDLLSFGSGLRAIVEERPGSPIQAMELVIVGAPWETPHALEGIADVAALALLQQPTDQGPTLEEFIASVGGRVQVRSEPDSVGLSVESLVEDFPAVADALFRALETFEVDEALLESTRRSAAADAATVNSRSEVLARSSLFASLFSEHPYGLSATAQSLQQIDEDELRRFLQRVVQGHRILVALVGGTGHGVVQGLLANTIGGEPERAPWSGPEPHPLAAKRSGRIFSHREVAQSQVAIGVATIGVASEDFPALQVAARLLWSRLFYTFVRGDQPIAYWLLADLSPRLGPSPLYVQAGVSPEDEPRLLDGVRELVEALASAPVDSEELEQAKGRLTGELAPQDSHIDQARSRARYELLLGAGTDLEKIANRIRRVSSEDVRRVVKQYLLPAEWMVSVVGPDIQND